jgi:hypothetical protein
MALVMWLDEDKSTEGEKVWRTQKSEKNMAHTNTATHTLDKMYLRF